MCELLLVLILLLPLIPAIFISRFVVRKADRAGLKYPDTLMILSLVLSYIIMLVIVILLLIPFFNRNVE